MPSPDKKAPVVKVSVEHINDFSGGLNTTISGSLLNEREAQVAEDISFEQKGTIVPRKGRRKRYSVPFANTPVLGLGQLYKQDGTARLIVATGTNLYSDKPNMATKWSNQEDFDKAGTTKTKYIDTSSSEGNIQLKLNYLPRVVADCADKTLFISIDSTITDETSITKYNDNAIKIAINEDKTLGYAKMSVPVDTSEPWLFSGYIRNGDATDGVRLVATRVDGSVVKGSDYVTATSYTKSVLKLSPEDLEEVMTFGVEVKGTATQYGYADGLILIPITQDDYDNASYVAPDFTDYEPINTNLSVVFSQGTGTDAVIGSDVKCAIGSDLDDTQDLAQGTLTDITVSGSNITLDTDLTWVPYEELTFNELIAL